MCSQNKKKECTTDDMGAKIENTDEKTVYDFFAYLAKKYVFPPERAKVLLARILGVLEQTQTEKNKSGSKGNGNEYNENNF